MKATIYQTNWSSVVQLVCVKYEARNKKSAECGFYSSWPSVFVSVYHFLWRERPSIIRPSIGGLGLIALRLLLIYACALLLLPVTVDIGVFAAFAVVDVVSF